MGYYSVLKRKEILTHSVKWMKLEDMVLSEPVIKGKKFYQFILHNSDYITNYIK